jgi:hypothetical protein
MSEDTWFSRIHVKDYINAIMLEEKIIEQRAPEEEAITEKSTPFIPYNARLFGIKFRVDQGESAEAISKILSNPKIFLDELYVKNYGNNVRIIAFIYTDNINNVWNTINELLELKSVSKIDILRTHKKTGLVMPNPWLFPPRIGREILSLIPQCEICRSGDSVILGSMRKLSELIREEIGGKSLEPEAIARIIYTFGLGVIDGSLYNDESVIIRIRCCSSIPSESYCRILGAFASYLYNGRVESSLDDKTCILVFKTT